MPVIDVPGRGGVSMTWDEYDAYLATRVLPSRGGSQSSGSSSRSTSYKESKKHEVHEMSSSELAKRREHRRALAQGATPAPVIGKRQRKELRREADRKHWAMLTRSSRC
jgi:hypothetical protein